MWKGIAATWLFLLMQAFRPTRPVRQLDHACARAMTCKLIHYGLIVFVVQGDGMSKVLVSEDGGERNGNGGV